MKEKLDKIRFWLSDNKIDGWLLYDNHGLNPLVKEILKIPQDIVLTRRFFYWIPIQGEPVKIVHQIEQNQLDFLPGIEMPYLSWLQLEKVLNDLLQKSRRIAMEYSPRNQNPYVSRVDAGTIELIREKGVEVVSSADILQLFTSVLDAKQLESHLKAAEILEQTVEKVWNFILNQPTDSITEFDVQEFIKNEFKLHRCISEEGPICAVGRHSALPHYVATEKAASKICKEDFILIDLWCKLDIPYSIYADITRVAVLRNKATDREQEIFDIVKIAQQKTITYIQESFHNKKDLCGAEVDDVCRGSMKEMGYDAYFTHRTGHNIDSNVHGSGAHFDNLEMQDRRKILPGMCFSIEPGIYIPNEFGVRLESNIYIDLHGRAMVSDHPQTKIITLL